MSHSFAASTVCPSTHSAHACSFARSGPPSWRHRSIQPQLSRRCCVSLSYLDDQALSLRFPLSKTLSKVLFKSRVSTSRGHHPLQASGSMLLHIRESSRDLHISAKARRVLTHEMTWFGLWVSSAPLISQQAPYDETVSQLVVCCRLTSLQQAGFSVRPLVQLQSCFLGSS